jgi:hypothetical protein
MLIEQIWMTQTQTTAMALQRDEGCLKPVMPVARGTLPRFLDLPELMHMTYRKAKVNSTLVDS